MTMSYIRGLVFSLLVATVIIAMPTVEAVDLTLQISTLLQMLGGQMNGTNSTLPWNSTFPSITNDTLGNHTNPTDTTPNGTLLSPPMWNSTLPELEAGNTTFTNGTSHVNGTNATIPSPPPIQGGAGGNSSTNPIPLYPPPPYSNGTVDTPSPPPPIQGGAGANPCQGVAYDGYLSKCTIYIDLNRDSSRGLEDPYGITDQGTFTIISPPAQLNGYIIRLQPESGDKRTSVQRGSSLCHDIATLLPERLPLAAVAPDQCGPNAPIAISALSTLLTFSEVTEERMKLVFSLPSNYQIGRTDGLRESIDGGPGAISIMRAEALAKSLVYQISEAVTVDSGIFSKVAQYTFASFARVIASPSNTQSDHFLSSSRKILYQSEEVTALSNTSTLQALFSDVIQTLEMDDTIPVNSIAYLSQDVMNAVAYSISMMQLLGNQAQTVEDILKMTYVLQGKLLEAVRALAQGNMTQSEFANTTSYTSLLSTWQQTSLPDGFIVDPLNPSPPAPIYPHPPPLQYPIPVEEGSASGSHALALGLGLGLGLPLFTATLIAGIIYGLRYRHQKLLRSRTPLKQPSSTRSSIIASMP